MGKQWQDEIKNQTGDDRPEELVFRDMDNFEECWNYFFLPPYEKKWSLWDALHHAPYIGLNQITESQYTLVLVVLTCIFTYNKEQIKHKMIL